MSNRQLTEKEARRIRELAPGDPGRQRLLTELYLDHAHELTLADLSVACQLYSTPAEVRQHVEQMARSKVKPQARLLKELLLEHGRNVTLPEIQVAVEIMAGEPEQRLREFVAGMAAGKERRGVAL